jgi:hypothetical protein
MSYTIVLDEKEVQSIIDALVERPFKEVNVLLNKVVGQVQAQQKEANDASNSSNLTQPGT